MTVKIPDFASFSRRAASFSRREPAGDERPPGRELALALVTEDAVVHRLDADVVSGRIFPVGQFDHPGRTAYVFPGETMAPCSTRSWPELADEATVVAA